MNKKYALQFQVSLTEDQPGGHFNQYGTQLAHETLDIGGLTFFQVCVILGGLQVLVNEEKNANSPIGPVTSA